MAKLKLTVVRCLNCGHEWLPRVPDPRICPKCGSVRWDRPHPGKPVTDDAEGKG